MVWEGLRVCVCVCVCVCVRVYELCMSRLDPKPEILNPKP